jgi:creatinine amidohydrolase
MRFEDLNWMDVEEYRKKDDRIMLILGACEQHGFLSLLTDIKIPQSLADAASQKSGVLVAPALNFGISPHFTSYPGTISLKVNTFLQVVEDIVEGLYAQGFKHLLILNGHGGNTPLTARLTEICNEHIDLKIHWYAWWTAASVTKVAEAHGLKSYHAAWIEAFPFVRVAELPQGEKQPATSRAVQNAEEYRTIYGDGVFGGPYQVDDAILDEIFSAAVEDILQLLKFEA